MPQNRLKSPEYHFWLKVIKQQVYQTQINISVKVNTTLLEFYWNFGADIVEKQKEPTWNDGFLTQLSVDLMAEFPESKFFSYRDIVFIKQWFLFDSWQNEIVKQTVSSLNESQISGFFPVPRDYHIVIMQKCKFIEMALFYAAKILENNWNHIVLLYQIKAEVNEYLIKEVA